MFVIQSIERNITHPTAVYMSYTYNYFSLFKVEWRPIIDSDTQHCQTLSEAINFLHVIHSDPFTPATWLTNFDIFICELDIGNNIISRTKYSPYNSMDDGIDYNTPGEALKAYRRGKVVDWKRLVEKN